MSGLFSNYSLRSKKRQTTYSLVHSAGHKPVVLWKYFKAVFVFFVLRVFFSMVTLQNHNVDGHTSHYNA